MRRVALFMICIFLVSFYKIDAKASEISIGVDKTFLELKSEPTGTISSKVKFRLSGGVKARIKIELCDVLVNKTGVKELLPLGATPSSPKNIFDIDSYEDIYTPNGKIQTFEVAILSTNPKPINKLVTGGLKISVDPTPFDSKKSTHRAIGVALTFVYSPTTHLPLMIKSRIQNSEVKISNSNSSPISRMWLPELSFIKSSGPINLIYKQKNTGNIFQVITDLVTVQRLGSSTDSLLYRTKMENRLLLPNQKIDKNVSIIDRAVNSNREINPLGWGIYQIRIISTGKYLDNETTTTISKRTLVILPWKHLLIFLLFTIILLKRRSRTKVEPPPLLDIKPKIAQAEEIKSTAVKKVVKKESVKKVVKKAPVKKVVKKAPVKKVVKKQQR